MQSVGYDQRLQFNHLDITANLLRTHPQNDMYVGLNQLLSDSIKGDKSRKNAITMLMKIWSLVDESIVQLRDDLMLDYPYLSPIQKRFVHYCLTCIAYPFFREQMSMMGKHFRLSEKVRNQLVIRDMKGIYGDRRRVEVAGAAVFGSVIEWGLLTRAKVGIYKSEIHGLELNELLTELALEVMYTYFETDSLSFDFLERNVLFFPFQSKFELGELNLDRYTIVRNISGICVNRIKSSNRD